jgi:Galactose oxidase, central domain
MILSVEQWKWLQLRAREGKAAPSPRTGHALVCVRNRVLCFGGLTEAGLANDLWGYDLNSLTWTKVPTFGQSPCPRRGATAVVDGSSRLVYVIGGHDGEAPLADVHVLDVERFSWTSMSVLGQAPPGREGASADMVGPYVVWGGGIAVSGHTPEVLADVWALHADRYATVTPKLTACGFEASCSPCRHSRA